MFDLSINRADTAIAAALPYDPSALDPEPSAAGQDDGVGEAAQAAPASSVAAPANAARSGAAPAIAAPRGRGWLAPTSFGGVKRPEGLEEAPLPTPEEFDALFPKEPPAFPVSPDHLRGRLGGVARHLGAASVGWSEAGAIATALPLLGAVMGQSWRTPTNLRTNVYTVPLGRSGTGKTALIAPAKRLLLKSGARVILGSDRFKSGAAIIQMLRTGPKICFLDEFGHLLAEISGKGASGPAKEILTELTKLFSSAGEIYTGTAVISRKDPPLPYPHLSACGFSTEGQFWSGLGAGAYEDGSAARFLLMPLGEVRAKKPDWSLERAACRAVKDILDARVGPPPGDEIDPEADWEAVEAPLSPDAAALEAEMKRTETGCATFAENAEMKGAGPLIRRTTENALKIALISAVGRNPAAPEIDLDDLRLGHAIAWWSAQMMVANIPLHAAENETERRINAIEKFIRDGGPEGRSQREVLRKFRWLTSPALKLHAGDLQHQGAIVIEEEPPARGGHPKITYRKA